MKSYQNLITALQEIFEEQKGLVDGVNDFTIPSGTFDRNFFYDGRENNAIGKSALYKPQLKFRIESIRGGNYLMSQLCTTKILDITLAIDLAYKTDSKFLKEKEDDIKVQIMDDINQIESTLTRPGNLTETIAGGITGLASGCFLRNTLNVSEFVFDRENSLLTSTITIDGIIQLDTFA